MTQFKAIENMSATDFAIRKNVRQKKVLQMFEREMSFPSDFKIKNRDKKQANIHACSWIEHVIAKIAFQIGHNRRDMNSPLKCFLQL